MPVAICAGIVAFVWYASDGGVLQPDKIAPRISPPALTLPSLEARKPVSASPDVSTLRVTVNRRLSLVSHGNREMKGIAATRGEEPKLESFPAVSQKGNIAGWLGRGDGGKLAAIAREASPEMVVAYQQLRSVQDKPIDIAAIEIEPLR